jgi:hypothetical protein
MHALAEHERRGGMPSVLEELGFDGGAGPTVGGFDRPPAGGADPLLAGQVEDHPAVSVESVEPGAHHLFSGCLNTGGCRRARRVVVPPTRHPRFHLLASAPHRGRRVSRREIRERNTLGLVDEVRPRPTAASWPGSTAARSRRWDSGLNRVRCGDHTNHVPL